MADEIQTTASGLEVAYQLTDELKIQAAGLEVAYLPYPSDLLIVDACGVEVAYLVETGPPATTRIFPVPPAARQLQSQAGKRTFPVVI